VDYRDTILAGIDCEYAVRYSLKDSFFQIPIILAIMLSMTGRSVKAENVKRDIVNLMEKMDEQCNGDEGCLKNMYKRLEENIGSHNKVYPGKDMFLRKVDQFFGVDADGDNLAKIDFFSFFPI